MRCIGRVVALGRRCCFVDLGGRVIGVAMKGTLVKKSRLYVGDIVTLETGSRESDARVVALQPRTSLLPRPAIANVDQILFVNTMREPPFDGPILDRCLFTASVLSVRSIIIFNKCDLLDEAERKRMQDVIAPYQHMGIVVVESSALSGKGIDSIVDLCTGWISCLAGLSGVGKSRILSRIFPNRTFVVNDISKHTERGRHTTTATTLIALSGGGYIADTPGFSLIDLPMIEENLVANHFPDFVHSLGQCRFNNCLHDQEPDCAVREMVQRGKIALSRYESYRRILLEIREKKKQRYAG